jgi:tetratricopeptide (TPR) repeat protein
MRPVSLAALTASLFLLAAAPVPAAEPASPAEAAAQLEARADALAPEGPGEAVRRMRLLRRAGQLWLVAGEPVPAIRAQSAALALAPDDAGLWIDRSIAHGLRGDHWAALDDLYHALDLEPGNVEAAIFRAATYRVLASPDLARDDLDRALTLDPDHPDALYDRGELRMALGDRAGGAGDWRRLIEVAPESAAALSARRAMARLGLKSDPEVAAKTGE